MTIGQNLSITLSKTSDGQSDYLQILSDDQFSLNIVLIADKIQVQDVRDPASCGGKLEHVERDPRKKKAKG